MSFLNIDIKSKYKSKINNVLNDFYIPLLKECKSYKRVSAYFNSGILNLYSEGLEKLIKNKGHAYFIFSNQISEKDFFDMKEGYEKRNANIAEKMFDDFEIEDSPNISNLAYLIKNGFVDVKIAFTYPGILHEKFGIFEDFENNIVYFRGSNNETPASLLSNYEGFETSCSRRASNDEIKNINCELNDFKKLWNNKEEGVLVVDIPRAVLKKILEYDKGCIVLTSYDIDNAFSLDLDNNNHLIGLNNLSEPECHIFDSETLFYKNNLAMDIFLREENKLIFSHGLGIKRIKEIINAFLRYKKFIASKYDYNFSFVVSPKLKDYINKFDLEIEKRNSLGIAIKQRDSIIINQFESFKEIVNSLMIRKMMDSQLWDSFHAVCMKASANFSVPGAGKTTVAYGAFAYLNYLGLIDKIVMIGPISSFNAWKEEFVACFGNLKKLKCYDFQEKKKTLSGFIENHDSLNFDARDSNLILINYESLATYADVLKSIINEKTFLILDEVHRIKAISGTRAEASLKLSDKPIYKLVMTGTPIPNGYIDISNFLHFLFPNDYDNFFGFDDFYLRQAKFNKIFSDKINAKLYPFFCRTTKKDLNVPPPEEDELLEITYESKKILEIIYKHYRSNPLLLYIRLMQASTNPKMLLNKLDSDDLELLRDKSGMLPSLEDDNSFNDEEIRFIRNLDLTPKFYAGIKKVKDLVSERKQVIVWGVFINTLFEVKSYLENEGITCSLIYGGTPISERTKIIDNFKNCKTSVLITNPHTLAESISLHKTCHHAVYIEFSFNLVHMLQSRDRIHRLGLSKDDKTYYTYLISKSYNSEFDYIDKLIYNRLKEKSVLQSKAVEGKRLVYIDDDMENDIYSLFNK